MEIRTLKEEEFSKLLSKLCSIYMEAYKELPNYGYQNKSETKRYLKWLYRGDPEGFLVAFKDSEPIGFISCHSNWWDSKLEKVVGEIHEFVVSPSFQGKGIGSKLFEESIKYLRNKGRNTVGLWVGEENDKARRSYEKRGFRYAGNWGKWRRMIKEYEID
ncbi:MAG: hypothetical protein PWQ16_380 [bacterium]|nr:hypothetical protein [bacterium]